MVVENGPFCDEVDHPHDLISFQVSRTGIMEARMSYCGRTNSCTSRDG